MLEFIKCYDLKYWSVPIIIIAVSTLMGLIDGHDQNIFPYKRIDIYEGEMWRLISGHFIHADWSHFLLNISGLLAIWFVYGQYLPRNTWLSAFIGLAFSISAAFYIFNSNLQQYVGLSGVLYGILTIVIIRVLLDFSVLRRSKFFYFGSLFIFGYLILRISYEQIYGPVSLSVRATQGNVIVDAHFYGMIFGVIMSLFSALKTGKMRLK